MEKELFYVGIRDPVEMRKELLMSSKNLIDSLKGYEGVKELREEKVQTIAELKRVYEELLVLNRKLRGKLPKTSLRGVPVQKEAPVPKVKPKKKQVVTPVPKTKLDVLEEELSKIESRLGSLE